MENSFYLLVFTLVRKVCVDREKKRTSTRVMKYFLIYLVVCKENISFIAAQLSWLLARAEYEYLESCCYRTATKVEILFFG